MSTSRARLRRAMATIRPSPTQTSEAATAITASAKIWPSISPWSRENPTKARFAALSMISSERSTISGLRRRSTPATPIAKRIDETARYHGMSGPITPHAPRRRRAPEPSRRRLLPVGLLLGLRAHPEHDAADRGDEQHDRRDLEREQEIREEQLADARGRAERAAHVGLVRELVARLEAHRHERHGE